MSITTCGGTIGRVIFTLVFQQLIGILGFGWTIRIMAFVILGSYSIAFPLILWGADNIGDIAPIGPTTKRKLFDVSALRDLPFWAYSISNFLIFCGYMALFVFLVSYGQLQLGMSRSLSLYMIVISQVASVMGRRIAAYMASRLGVMVPWFLCMLTSGVLCIAWIEAKSNASLITLAALHGGSSGGIIPLPPSIFSVVCPDKQVLGARLGMATGFGSIASLIGPPIAALAQVNDQSKVNFLGLQLFTELVMIVGSINLLGLWILSVKTREVKMLV